MKTFFSIVIWITIFLAFHYIGQETRKISQCNKFVHEALIVTDFIAFQQNGGGSFGYNNYFKWIYAKWRADPKRTTFEKIMFWNVGLFYEATNPPEKYKYPFVL